jgi:hypothetical protein
MNIQKLISAILLSAFAILILSGCGKSGSNNPLVDSSVKQYRQTTTLSGSVSGDKHMLPTGKVEALSEGGSVLATTTLKDGRYALVIPAATKLPLILKAHADNAQGSITVLEAVAVDPSLKKYDINPLSTAIAAKARQLGGYSRENMVEAAMTSVAVPDANKTTGGFRGDPTKQYGGWH